MYRFLAQPDPPESIAPDAELRAQYVGVDYVLLSQRKACLRPDSAVVVVMITDEDDSAVDGRSLEGRGWYYASRDYPGSKVARGSAAQGTTASRSTSSCASNPLAPDCVSCAFCALDPACTASKGDPRCTVSGAGGQGGPGFDGFYEATDDSLSVRMHDMKRRFGVDPQFPIERYTRALTNRKVPDRATEHGAKGVYTHASTCTNPLFAAQLPEKMGDDLCNLPEGSRSRQLVFFDLIGGVPGQLVTPAPDWTKILGKAPELYDRTGIDPHMIASTEPRPGLVGAELPVGNNGADPIHGREWTTSKNDLQYACTFVLPQPRPCAQNDLTCECYADPDMSTRNPPLCDSTDPSVQIRAKAYPTTRELRLVKDLGDRALVSSICTPDRDAGFGPALEALAVRVGASLAK